MYASSNIEPGQRLRSNMFSLSGAEFFGAVGRSINLGKLCCLLVIMYMINVCDFYATIY